MSNIQIAIKMYEDTKGTLGKDGAAKYATEYLLAQDEPFSLVLALVEHVTKDGVS